MANPTHVLFPLYANGTICHASFLTHLKYAVDIALVGCLNGGSSITQYFFRLVEGILSFNITTFYHKPKYQPGSAC